MNALFSVKRSQDFVITLYRECTYHRKAKLNIIAKILTNNHIKNILLFFGKPTERITKKILLR